MTVTSAVKNSTTHTATSNVCNERSDIHAAYRMCSFWRCTCSSCCSSSSGGQQAESMHDVTPGAAPEKTCNRITGSTKSIVLHSSTSCVTPCKSASESDEQLYDIHIVLHVNVTLYPIFSFLFYVNLTLSNFLANF